MVTFYHSSQTQINQSSPDSVRIQGPFKDLALAACIQSLLSKNIIDTLENVQSLGFYSGLLWPQASLKVEASDRSKQAQPLSTCRKVQN